MKNKFFKILSFIIILMMFCTLSSCNYNKKMVYEVTFEYNNGNSSTKVEVQEGMTISTPMDPYKENYLFEGWYLDYNLYNKYDFSLEVNNSFTLYAKYILDAAEITNKISNDLIKGVVKIYNKCYNTFLLIPYESSTSQGSGFCFHIQDGYYYFLTNCHVAVLRSGYKKQEFTVVDYQGNEYEAYLYHNPNKNFSAISEGYDLACLYIKPSKTDIMELDFDNDNPSFKDDVISIGAPNGQQNTITYGKVSGYRQITLDDTTPKESNVTFNVVAHNAKIDKGSSGGPLLNSKLNVVGVNYASSTDGTAYAIPLVKVKSFLKIYVYN